MLLPELVALREHWRQHRAQQPDHSSLYVVSEGSVGMDRGRVETDQQTGFGPVLAGRMRVEIGSTVVDAVKAAAAAAAAAAAVALVELAGDGSSDYLPEDAPKCGSSRCEASVSP